ncbi:hypothetical protein BH23ACT7_BH23ACT7_13560 [soil metagenome]
MTPSDPSRGAPSRSWAARYEHGRIATETRRDFWADMDSGWVMVAELVSATFVWGGIGWLLDRWLGTAPWLLSIGFVVGWATGFYLVYLRSSGRIGGRPAGHPPRSSPDGTTEGAAHGSH